MKRFLTRLLVVLAVLGVPQVAGASAAYVQSSTNAVTAATTVTGTLTNTAGNFLVVAVVADSGVTVSTVADTKTNTWARATGRLFNFSTKNVEVWYALNAAAGANTVTVTWSASADSALVFGEYSGVLTAAALDVTSAAFSGDGVNSSPADSGVTATTAQASELLIGGMATFATAAQTTATGGHTIRASKLEPTSGATVFLQDTNVTITGTYNSTDTLSPTNQWAATVSTFKATAAGGGGGTCQSRGLLGVGCR